MAKRAKKDGSDKGHSEELTLRLRGNLITPEDFRKAVHGFTELLLQVTEQIAIGGKRPIWNMSVRKGSSVLVARPIPDVETVKPARDTIKALRRGIGLLETGKSEIPYFTPRAMVAARGLGELRVKPNKVGITSVEISNGDGKINAVTSKTAETVSKQVGAQRSAWGAIEGTLQTISNRSGFQFVVYEPLTDRGVNCFVRPDRFREAHTAFGKRVRVSGLIQYDKSGKPLAIEVESVRVFRTTEEIGSIEQFQGFLKKESA